MQQETAFSHALGAIAFIIADDELKDRFLALTGLSPDDFKQNIDKDAFLASVLEFLIAHEPDLIAYAEAQKTPPDDIVRAWRVLGGGVGQEW